MLAVLTTVRGMPVAERDRDAYMPPPEPMPGLQATQKAANSISDRYLNGNHLCRRRVIIKRL